jgi:hypothetical protein
VLYPPAHSPPSMPGHHAPSQLLRLPSSYPAKQARSSDGT